LRYFLVGGSMSLGFAGLLWAFHSAGLYGWLSSVLASACMTIPTVLLHRYFTFGVEGSLVSQAAGTLAIAAWNLPVGAGIVFMLVDLLGWNAFVSGLIATSAAALLNYTLFTRVVFRRPTP